MNYCSKCGNKLDPNQRFCNKCGNTVTTNIVNQNIQNNNNNNKKGILVGVGIGLGTILIIFLISLIFKNPSNDYYFDSNNEGNNDEITHTNSNQTTSKSKYLTAIIYDNTYEGVTVNKDTDAYKLIVKDSVEQKNKCPEEIKKIEDQMISKYGITAVNLCEMDINFAKEISNVFDKIYNEYPSARGYITNISLANVPMSEGYIAAFMPAFSFATSNTDSTYPWVIKTQILLNTSYFLNSERLEASVTDGSTSGHFPPNATMYSPVAHELGHYLSFLAMMKNYNMKSILMINDNNINNFYNIYTDFGKGDFSLKMINEAYNNYKNDTKTTLSLDDFRGTISKYALAKDNSGEYIYDETIAEAFHDVYLNGDNAKDASKYIVKVLKKKLGS